MMASEDYRARDVAIILRHMHDLKAGLRGDLLPEARMDAAWDWATHAGCDAAARIVAIDHEWRAQKGKAPDEGFDAWVAAWAADPSTRSHWDLCEESVSFAGRRIPWEERGMLDDHEARILCDDLKARMGAAMRIGRDIARNAYRWEAGDVSQDSIHVNAARVLRMMRVNPLAVLDLIDECDDLLTPDDIKRARSLAWTEWEMMVEEDAREYRGGRDGMEMEWRTLTSLTRTGLQFPSLGAYRVA